MGTNRKLRIVPLIVACPLFLQNLDTSVMASALPSIAASLQVQILDLNLAITAYLLSLAVFLPASAWLAGRLGAKRVFCAAVILFSLASALCAAAQTLGELVAYRLVQGIGGSMMVPVGRSILLRSVPADQMVKAMVWFTLPGAIGRLMGPLAGGAIVTVTSWHWIFLVNIPFGLLGAALAWWLIDTDPAPSAPDIPALDLPGLALLAVALVGILGGLEMAGKSILPLPAVAAIFLTGVLAGLAYLRRSQSVPHPVIDLGVLRFSTFRVAMLGGFPLRVAIGAAPFLLPLLFQVGFGLSPLESGLLAMGTAVGALFTRAIVGPAIARFGFRSLVIVSTVLAALFYASYGLFSAATPRAWMFFVLFLGGLCTALTMVSVNTVGYVDIPPNRSGHATAFSSMGQQVSTALGVMLGACALALGSVAQGRSPEQLQVQDFAGAFFLIAALALWSAWSFRGFRPQDGAHLREAEKLRA